MPAGFDHVQAKIVDRQVVLHLEPARFLAPAQLTQGDAGHAGDQLRPALTQPVDHFWQFPALVAVWAVEVAVLVEQLEAFLGLALAGEEHALD